MKKILLLMALSIFSNPVYANTVQCLKTFEWSAVEIFSKGKILLSAYDQDKEMGFFTVLVNENIRLDIGCIKRGFYHCSAYETFGEARLTCTYGVGHVIDK